MKSCNNQPGTAEEREEMNQKAPFNGTCRPQTKIMRGFGAVSLLLCKFWGYQDHNLHNFWCIEDMFL